MSWTLRIPFRSRDESLVDVASYARTLGQDDARVVRQIVLQAYTDRVAKSAGELLDHLDGLDPHQRRAMLDSARQACGLPSTDEIDTENGAHLVRVGRNRRPMRLEHREGGAIVEVYEDDAVVIETAERTRIAATRP
jgi:hypothetical protein